MVGLCRRLIRRIYQMRGRKVVSPTQHPTHHQQPKTHLVKSPRRRKIHEVRSAQTKPEIVPRSTQATRHRPHLVASPKPPAEAERKQRQTMQFIPISATNTPQPVMVQEWGQYRTQRNTAQIHPRSREQHLISRESARNSHHNSQRKIKIFSAEQKDKSLSNSERSTSRRKPGIEVTKTLLKRISDMYSDKDFQNRSGTCSHKEQSTGMTLNASGRGVADEYQLNDSDLPAMANHTITMSYSRNPLSFNDSGNWNDNSLPKIAPPPLQTILVRQQPSPSPVKRIEQPKKAGMDMMGGGPTTESIVVGPEPPSRHSLIRRDGRSPPCDSFSERYLIRSKNKTMSQLSLKESTVVGHDYHFYQ